MTDETFIKLGEFQKDFKALVRKYVPSFPKGAKTMEDQEQLELLAAMQDSTSCFNPFVWSDTK